MSQLEEIKARAEVNQYLGKTASQDEAKATLKLIAALEAVEVELVDLDELQAEHASFFDGANVSAGSVAKTIRSAIAEALQ